MKTFQYGIKPTHFFHRITMKGSKCKFSAWFNGNPLETGSMAILIDAERIDAKGRSYPVTDSQWGQLEDGPWYAVQTGKFSP